MATHKDPDRNSETQPNSDSQPDLDVQQIVFANRQISLADVIAKEGGSFMKGVSPVPKLLQVTTEINSYIAKHIVDSSGALQAVLQNWVKADEVRISQNLDQPLKALVAIVEAILSNTELFYEFVRQVDVRWGEIYDERPYFQRPGQTPHPDDEYTHESVREQLIDLLKSLMSQHP